MKESQSGHQAKEARHGDSSLPNVVYSAYNGIIGYPLLKMERELGQFCWRWNESRDVFRGLVCFLSGFLCLEGSFVVLRFCLLFVYSQDHSIIDSWVHLWLQAIRYTDCYNRNGERGAKEKRKKESRSKMKDTERDSQDFRWRSQITSDK